MLLKDIKIDHAEMDQWAFWWDSKGELYFETPTSPEYLCELGLDWVCGVHEGKLYLLDRSIKKRPFEAASQKPNPYVAAKSFRPTPRALTLFYENRTYEVLPGVEDMYAWIVEDRYPEAIASVGYIEGEWRFFPHANKTPTADAYQGRTRYFKTECEARFCAWKWLSAYRRGELVVNTNTATAKETTPAKQSEKPTYIFYKTGQEKVFLEPDRFVTAIHKRFPDALATVSCQTYGAICEDWWFAFVKKEGRDLTGFEDLFRMRRFDTEAEALEFATARVEQWRNKNAEAKQAKPVRKGKPGQYSFRAKQPDWQRILDENPGKPGLVLEVKRVNGGGFFVVYRPHDSAFGTSGPFLHRSAAEAELQSVTERVAEKKREAERGPKWTVYTE